MTKITAIDVDHTPTINEVKLVAMVKNLGEVARHSNAVILEYDIADMSEEIRMCHDRDIGGIVSGGITLTACIAAVVGILSGKLRP